MCQCSLKSKILSFLKVKGCGGCRERSEIFKILESKGLRPVKTFPISIGLEPNFWLRKPTCFDDRKRCSKCEEIVGYDFWSISLEYCLPKAFGDAVLKKVGVI